MEIEAKIKEILKSTEGKKLGVFCDGANLFYGKQKYGWQVDFEKFKKFLCPIPSMPWLVIIWCQPRKLAPI